MNAKVFFDTNVFVYAVTSDDRRSIPAQAMLAGGGSISVQALNEFAQSARRKLKRSWTKIGVALTVLRERCSECLPITERTMIRSLSRRRSKRSAQV
jgi:predicted nucleic acid-binding protein